VKKILVIGCNSFSGSSFIDYLDKNKFKIYGISRYSYKTNFNRFYNNSKKIIFKQLNLNKDLEKICTYIKKIKPDYIINFTSESMVAESWLFPEDWYRLNSYILPTFYHKITNFRFIKKVIHFSTPEVYGSTKGKISENNFFKPSTPYGISRVTADQTCQTLFKFRKFPVIITRASNVYGEYQRLYRIIPKTIIFLLKNKKINLHGGGKSKRNFIHIDDVSEALIILLKKGVNGETYHISSKKIITIKDLVKLVGLKFNKKLIHIAKISKDRLGKDDLYFLNSNKLKKLGWKPKISLENGINRVIGWISRNSSILKKEKVFYEHKKKSY